MDASSMQHANGILRCRCLFRIDNPCRSGASYPCARSGLVENSRGQHKLPRDTSGHVGHDSSTSEHLVTQGGVLVLVALGFAFVALGLAFVWAPKTSGGSPLVGVQEDWVVPKSWEIVTPQSADRKNGRVACSFRVPGRVLGRSF